MKAHNERIVEQFSLQAAPFTKVAGHLDSVNLLIDMAGITSESTVLDLACGPGIVACEFAKHAKHVTGIDITPAMIEQAKSRQSENKLTNLSWQVGDVTKLPYPDNSFNTVITRYSFHHFENPKAVLNEMIRVCKAGGTVLIADVVLPADKVEKYDALELIRDPSHVHALTHDEMEHLISSSPLTNVKIANYKVEIELEQQMKASFPNEGDEQKIRQMLIDELSNDRMGINTHTKNGQIHYEVPITVIAGTP